MKIQVGNDAMEIDDSKVIQFKEGLLGFHDSKSFVIFDHDSDNAPFKWLQSTKDPNLGFIIMDPLLVKPDYRPVIPVQELKSMDTDNLDDIVVLSILTVHNNSPAESTVNLNGPLLVNEKKMLGKQVVLTECGYSCTESLIDNSRATASSADSKPTEKQVCNR